MKIRLFLLFALLCGSVSVWGQKKILIAGSGWGKIVLFDRESDRVEWSHALNQGDECNCVDYTKKGEVLYAYQKGAKLITMDHQVVWDFPITEGELQTAKVLPDGGFLLAICGKPARVIELDKKGKIRKEFTFDTQINSFHGQLRQVSKTKTGGYLVALMDRKAVLELDKDGKELRCYQAAGNCFKAIELKNGNLLVACGDGHCYQELDRVTGNVVKHVGQQGVEGVAFQFVAEVVPVRKGGLLICNWSGHSSVKDQSSLVEIDADGKLVWALNGRHGFNLVSTVCLVDE